MVKKVVSLLFGQYANFCWHMLSQGCFILFIRQWEIQLKNTFVKPSLLLMIGFTIASNVITRSPATICSMRRSLQINPPICATNSTKNSVAASTAVIAALTASGQAAGVHSLLLDYANANTSFPVSGTCLVVDTDGCHISYGRALTTACCLNCKVMQSAIFETSAMMSMVPPA